MSKRDQSDESETRLGVVQNGPGDVMEIRGTKMNIVELGGNVRVTFSLVWDRETSDGRRESYFRFQEYSGWSGTC